jgi:aspartate aminotransferase
MVAAAMTPRTRAIILNTPNNPSGAVVPPDQVREIVRLAHERGIYVICDECYVYLNYAGEPFSAGSVREAKEHLVVIGSFSKTYAMTGWRMGYALAPQPIAAAIQKLQSQSTSSSAELVQRAALAAVNGPQDCIAEFRKEYIRLLDRVLKGLSEIPGITCNRPQGAFYVYPNVTAFFGRSGIKSSADIAKRLLNEAHVVTVPGEGFGTTEHIRLSYAVSDKEIDRGVERMKKFFGSL